MTLLVGAKRRSSSLTRNCGYARSCPRQQTHAKRVSRSLFRLGTLRTIEIAFESEDFQPNLTYEPPGISGQRRWLVEQYYAAIDFAHPKQVFRLLRVYDDLISQIQPNNPDEAARLRGCLERDGFKFEGRRLVIRNPLARFHDLRAAAEELSSADILAHVERVEAAIGTDPALAVGSAKELLETTCKTILAARRVQTEKTDDVP
jgi:hypothetical protein